MKHIMVTSLAGMGSGERLPLKNAQMTGGVASRNSFSTPSLLMGLALVSVSHFLDVNHGFSFGRTALLLSMCAFIVAYGVFRDPYAPFYVWAFVEPTVLAVGTNLALVFGGMAALIVNKKTIDWKWRFSFIGLLFCLWYAASVGWAVQPNFTVNGFFVSTLPLIVMAVLISGLADPVFRKNLVVMVVIACVIGSLFALRNWSRGEFGIYTEGRTPSLMQPDIFAPWCVFGFLGAQICFAEGQLPSWVRRLLLLAMGIIILGLGLSGMRGPILAAGIGTLLITIGQKRTLRGLLLVTLTAAIGAGLYWTQPDMFSGITSRFQTMSEDEGSGRLDIWRASLKVFADSPIIGVGCDQFNVAVSRYHGGELAATHNIYIGTLVEQGVVGIALMLCWFGVLLLKVWHAQDRLWRFPLLVSFLCLGQVLHLFYFSSFWLVLGLAEGGCSQVGGQGGLAETSAGERHLPPSATVRPHLRRMILKYRHRFRPERRTRDFSVLRQSRQRLLSAFR